MHNALALFQANIGSARNLSAVHAFLAANVVTPLSYDDLLRSQLVYAVSALDKLLHDLIRIGMVQTFTGIRQPTAKYLTESISLELHGNLVLASVPPKEYLFEQAIFLKLNTMSFQEPTKIADGLSYIWDETHKWQKIAAAMTMAQDAAKTELKLIVDKRNAIVHEADIDPMTSAKRPLTEAECIRATDFVSHCGVVIAQLVT
jgi:hypothetical protein